MVNFCISKSLFLSQKSSSGRLIFKQSWNNIIIFFIMNFQSNELHYIFRTFILKLRLIFVLILIVFDIKGLILLLNLFPFWSFSKMMFFFILGSIFIFKFKKSGWRKFKRMIIYTVSDKARPSAVWAEWHCKFYTVRE